MKKIVTIVLIGVILCLCGCQNANNESDTNSYNSFEYTEGEFTGLWQHTEYPEQYSVVIFNQNGNTISFEATAVRGSGSQIATSQVPDISLVDGEGSFMFGDSFGNSGQGEISISGNSLTLEYDTNEPYQGNWCIDAGEGNYVKVKELSELPDYAPQTDNGFISDDEEITLETYIPTDETFYRVIEYRKDGEEIYDEDITLYIGEYEHDTVVYENGQKITQKQPNAHFFQSKIYGDFDAATTGYCKAYPSDRAGYDTKLVVNYYDEHTDILYLKVIVSQQVFELFHESGESFGIYETSDYAYRDSETGGYMRRDYEYKEYYNKPYSWKPSVEKID